MTKVKTLISALLFIALGTFISSCNLQDKAKVPLLNADAINRSVTSIGETTVTTDRDLSENKPVTPESEKKKPWPE